VVRLSLVQLYSRRKEVLLPVSKRLSVFLKLLGSFERDKPLLLPGFEVSTLDLPTRMVLTLDCVVGAPKKKKKLR
jgi:hypothetical protein